MRAAWRSKGKPIRQNTQFDALQDREPVILPAKFTGQYLDIEWFLNAMHNYLDDTEVKSPKRQVLVTLSRMDNNDWVNHTLQTVTDIQDDVPYVWEHFVKLFKSHFT